MDGRKELQSRERSCKFEHVHTYKALIPASSYRCPLFGVLVLPPPLQGKHPFLRVRVNARWDGGRVGEE